MDRLLPTGLEPLGEEIVPVRRLRKDAEANRRQILEAAGRLMAERGLATPLEDIASAAGVGIATLYRRFPTRRELIEALFQDRIAAYIEDLRTAVAMPDAWQGLVWFLQSASGRQIADRALSEILEQDIGDEAIRRLKDQVRPLADELVSRARDTGRLRADFTVSDLIFVQQMLVGVGAATLALGATVWHRYMTIVLDGMVTSRSEPTKPAQAAPTIGQLESLHTGQLFQNRRPATGRR